MDRSKLEEAARRDFPQNFIQEIRAHRVDPGQGVLMLRVRWLGWGPESDTDEPIHQLVEDDPHRVEAYLSEHRDDEVCARYLQEYFGA